MKALIGLMMALALVGCGKSSSNNGTASPVSPYGYGYGPTLIPSCIPGDPLCVQTIPPQTTRIGFYAQSANMSGYYLNNGSTFNVGGSGLKAMLKEAMGVCDRDYANYGLSDCNAWVNGYHDLVFMMDGSTSNQVRVMMRSYPQVSQFGYYTASLPSISQFFSTMLGFPQYNYQGFFNPMILNGTIWPINNSQGFEIRANGPTGSQGYNRLLQLQVTSGKVEDERFTFILHYNGAQVATGTMVRCQSLTCGLPL